MAATKIQSRILPSKPKIAFSIREGERENARRQLLGKEIALRHKAIYNRKFVGKVVQFEEKIK